VVQGRGSRGKLSAGGEDEMMGINDIMGRCMDAMGSMMGSGIVPVVLLLVLLVWLAGLWPPAGRWGSGR
jgi:hypothetical protein